MADHVPFPEDDRSRTPKHGDPLLRAFDQKHGGADIDLTVDDECRVVTLAIELDIIDQCGECWQHTFNGAPPCERHPA